MIVFLTTLLILLCLAVVLLILIQRTSGGMGSALGGGAADQYLGAGSAAQLSKLTVWGILFFLFCLSVFMHSIKARQVRRLNFYALRTLPPSSFPEMWLCLLLPIAMRPHQKMQHLQPRYRLSLWHREIQASSSLLSVVQFQWSFVSSFFSFVVLFI